MKIIVFSDSHNNVYNMIEVVKACETDASLIVHLGDMTADSRRLHEKFPDIPMIYVKGNNDYFDFVLIDCPAGIEQGFKNAIAKLNSG